MLDRVLVPGVEWGETLVQQYPLRSPPLRNSVCLRSSDRRGVDSDLGGVFEAGGLRALKSGSRFRFSEFIVRFH